MKRFIWEAMSESGSVSFKRCFAAWFVFLFTLELVVNAIGKQRVLAETLSTQLFEGLAGSFAAVTGVGLYNYYKELKIRQSDNNASVGAASPPPPPDTTIVK